MTNDTSEIPRKDIPENAPSLSIVIPARNEAGNLPGVVHACVAALQSLTDRYDIVVVNDASTDTTAEVLRQLAYEIPQLTIINNTTRRGCHPSAVIGWKLAQGDWRLFLPADGQILPNVLPTFLQAVQNHPQTGVIYSWRQQRADNWLRRAASGLYNKGVHKLLELPVHDVDSAAMISRHVAGQVLPYLKADDGFLTVELLMEARKQQLGIGEVVIEHHPRRTGVSQAAFGPDAWRLPLRLLNLWWVTRDKPELPPASCSWRRHRKNS